MWDDDVSPEVQLQQDLWSAAYELDVDRVARALSAGAPPEPIFPVSSHGRQSPLVRALESPHGSYHSGDSRRQQVIELLLDARKAHPAASPPPAALAAALEKGDRWALEKLLPFYEKGINTSLPLKSDRAVSYAIQHLDNQESFPAGRLSGKALFDWVMSKDPSLEVSDAVAYTNWLEPLPFALQKYSQSSPGSNQQELYGHAVSTLVSRNAPVWIEGVSQSWSSALIIVNSQNPAWARHLMSQMPKGHWDKLEGRIKDDKALAWFKQLRLEKGLDPARPLLDDQDPPGPRIRF